MAENDFKGYGTGFSGILLDVYFFIHVFIYNIKFKVLIVLDIY